jgi:hypothetical protein
MTAASSPEGELLIPGLVASNWPEVDGEVAVLASRLVPGCESTGSTAPSSGSAQATANRLADRTNSKTDEPR